MKYQRFEELILEAACDGRFESQSPENISTDIRAEIETKKAKIYACDTELANVVKLYAKFPDNVIIENQITEYNQVSKTLSEELRILNAKLSSVSPDRIVERQNAMTKYRHELRSASTDDEIFVIRTRMADQLAEIILGIIMYPDGCFYVHARNKSIDWNVGRTVKNINPRDTYALEYYPDIDRLDEAGCFDHNDTELRRVEWRRREVERKTGKPWLEVRNEIRASKVPGASTDLDYDSIFDWPYDKPGKSAPPS